MKNKIKFLFLLLFFYGCSLDTKSGFWSKTEKLNDEKVKKLFVEKSVLDKEFNTNIKINIKKVNSKNTFSNNPSNNNGNINYLGALKNISKYKFKKIDNFKYLKPELSFTANNSVIFYNNKGAIIKFDENSNLEWKVNIYNKKEIKLKPTLTFANNNEFLVVVDNLGKYYAINLNNGTLIWSKKNNAPFNSQVKIQKDRFFVVDYTDTLKCFSIKNGKEIWKSTSESSLIKSKDRLSLVINKNIAIYQNSLGDIVAANINNGNLIWQTPTEKNVINQNNFTIRNSDLVLENNSVFFSNNQNNFYSLDLNTGIINWSESLSSNLRPIIVDDIIMTVSDKGYLYIMEKQSGNIIRITDVFSNFKLKKRKKIQPTGFVASQNNIYLSTNIGQLLVVKTSDGKKSLSYKISREKISKPYINNRKLYVVKNNEIIRLD